MARPDWTPQFLHQMRATGGSVAEEVDKAIFDSGCPTVDLKERLDVSGIPGPVPLGRFKLCES